MIKRWTRVEVTDESGQVVSIEDAMLAGRDIGEREREAITDSIRTLCGFIGLPDPVDGVQERDTRARRVAWQPIETADQNAELLWLFDPTEGVAIGFWDFMDGYWRGVETSGLSGGRITPTHQAPLTMPDPPAPPVRD